MSDAVNHPSHYADKKIEVIDYIRDTLPPSGFVDYCLGNVIKYVSRWRKKGGAEDLKPESIKNNKNVLNEYGIALDAIKTFYQKALKEGVPKEDARFILPQAVKTNIVLTMNARELRHFFSLRCCNRAQWEIRALADEMLRLCKEKCPLIFSDAGPGCVRGNCPETKPCGTPRMNEALFLPFKKED